jgi:acyl dehydratase
MPLYFEDFHEGDQHVTPGRSITESDVMRFAGLSGDFNPAHTDYEYAKAGPFGAPIAHGLLTLVVIAGLADRGGLLDGSAIALLGVEWRFKQAVMFNDTIRARLTVTSKRVTSKGDRGILVRKVEVLNQRGEVVQEGSFTTMVWLRGHAPGATDDNPGRGRNP